MLEIYPLKMDVSAINSQVSQLKTMLQNGNSTELEALLPILQKLPELVLMAIYFNHRLECELEAGGTGPSPLLSELIECIRETGLVKATLLYNLNR